MVIDNTMQDTGHTQLIADIEKLLDEARRFEFHDFKNTSFAAPKMVLAETLRIMRNKTLNGKYDN